MKNAALISAIIYSGASLVVTGLFLLGTLAGRYALAERIGGAAWVFLLSMIILMPVVIQRVKNRLGGVNRPSSATSEVSGMGGVIMAIDPVCGMEVDEKKPAATSEYKGKKYYFCAMGCKRAFDQNPEKYLAKPKK